MNKEYQELQERKRKWIPLACEGKCSIREASIKIGITPYSVSRLKRRYRLYGDSIFINGHKGKDNPQKIFSDEKRTEICEIYKKDYQGVSFKFFRDCLASNHNIEISVVHLTKILNDAGIFSPKQYDLKYLKFRKEKILEIEKAFHDFSDFLCTVNADEDGTEHIGINNNGLSDASMSFLRKIYCQKLSDFSKENFIRTKRDTKINLNSAKLVLEDIYSFLNEREKYAKYGRCIEVCVSDALNLYHFEAILDFMDKNIDKYTGIKKDIKSVLIKLGELSKKTYTIHFYGV